MSHKFIPYNSDTTGNEPASASLIKGELAVNIADKKLWVGDASGDPVALNSPLPIEEPITYYVGTGRDFETFHEAMRWAEKQTFSGVGALTLRLEDGTHEVGEPSELSTSSFSYYNFVNANITVRSESGNELACFLTMPVTDDADQWPIIVSVVDSSFTFSTMTFDWGLSSYPYPTHITLLSGARSSSIGMRWSVINNGYQTLYASGVTPATLINTTIDSNDTAVDMFGGAFSGFGIILSNNAVGVSVRDMGKADVSGVTFTTNTADTNIPLNEIQYDGSYITTNTVALSFKA